MNDLNLKIIFMLGIIGVVYAMVWIGAIIESGLVG